MDVSGPGLTSIKWDVFTAGYRKIRGRSFPAGAFNQVQWDLEDKEGNRVASGIYYFRVETNGLSGKKVVVHKVLVFR